MRGDKMAQRIRELIEKRDKFSKHYLRDDGLIDTEISISPIHHKNESGQFEDDVLDWELEKGFGKKLKKANHQLRLWNNTLRFGFDKNVYVDYVLPVNVDNASYQGNKCKLTDAWGCTDLEYTITPSGIKEDIILKQPGHPAMFVFPISTKNCTPVLDGNRLIYKDSNGNIIGQVNPPFMTDTDGNIGEVDILYDGVTLAFVPDVEFLTRAVYPVAIDPTTVTLDATSSGAVYASNSNYYTALDATSGTTVSSIQASVQKGSSTYYVIRSAIRHNTTSIPAEATINSVIFRGYFLGSLAGGDAIAYFYTYSGTFPPGTSNYNSTYYGTTILGTVNTTGLVENAYTDINLDPSIVVKGGTTKIGFRSQMDINRTIPPTVATYGVAFANHSSATPPKLIITYYINTAPTMPIINTVSSPVSSITHVTYTPSTDADGDPITYTAELTTDGTNYHAKTITNLTANSFDIDTSGEPASTNCMIRLKSSDGSLDSAWAYSSTFTIQHAVSVEITFNLLPNTSIANNESVITGVKNVSIASEIIAISNSNYQLGISGEAIIFPGLQSINANVFTQTMTGDALISALLSSISESIQEALLSADGNVLTNTALISTNTYDFEVILVNDVNILSLLVDINLVPNQINFIAEGNYSVDTNIANIEALSLMPDIGSMCNITILSEISANQINTYSFDLSTVFNLILNINLSDTAADYNIASIAAETSRIVNISPTDIDLYSIDTFISSQVNKLIEALQTALNTVCNDANIKSEVNRIISVDSSSIVQNTLISHAQAVYNMLLNLSVSSVNVETFIQQIRVQYFRRFTCVTIDFNKTYDSLAEVQKTHKALAKMMETNKTEVTMP
jgi:hypothetical protein